MRRLVVPTFIAATVVWLLLLSVTPLLPVPLAAIMYGFGSSICHQLADRSFHLGAAQLPVCARCLGIYAGLALASLVTVLARSTVGPDGLSPRRVLVLGALPTIITVATEWVGFWQPSNVVRAFSGVPLGCAVSLVVIGALTTLHYAQCAPRRPIAPPHQRIPF